MPSQSVLARVAALSDTIDHFEALSEFTEQDRADFYITLLAAFAYGEATYRGIPVEAVLAEVLDQIRIAHEADREVN